MKLILPFTFNENTSLGSISNALSNTMIGIDLTFLYTIVFKMTE